MAIPSKDVKGLVERQRLHAGVCTDGPMLGCHPAAANQLLPTLKEEVRLQTEPQDILYF